jgi:hypothetical protein
MKTRRFERIAQRTCRSNRQRPTPLVTARTPPMHPFLTASASPAQTSPVAIDELERAIVEVVMSGLGDVARVLARQLEDRRRAPLPENVVPLRGRGEH